MFACFIYTMMNIYENTPVLCPSSIAPEKLASVRKEDGDTDQRCIVVLERGAMVVSVR